MAIAFDDVSTRQAATGTSLTFAKTCTGSNLVLVVGVDADSDVVTGVTYNGIALTQIGKVAVPTGGREVYLYYLLNPTTGSNNVVISTSSSVDIIAYASSYTGVKQSAQPDASTTKTDTAVTTLTTSVVTVADNCWTILFARNGGAGMTGGAGTTVRGNTANAEQLADSNGAITPAGSSSLILNWTGNQNIGAVMASFAPFVAGVATISNNDSFFM